MRHKCDPWNCVTFRVHPCLHLSTHACHTRLYHKQVLHALLDKLADNVADYCRFQVSSAMHNEGVPARPSQMHAGTQLHTAFAGTSMWTLNCSGTHVMIVCVHMRTQVWRPNCLRLRCADTQLHTVFPGTVTHSLERQDVRLCRCKTGGLIDTCVPGVHVHQRASLHTELI